MTTTCENLPEPSPWVVLWSGALSAGASVLDLACGRGRHAVYLRDKGINVTAVDRDISHIRSIHGIKVIAADLENGEPWPLGENTYDAVIVVNYLYRPLFPTLLSTVKRGGLFMYETFMQGHQAYGRPTNPDYLLKPGELKSVVGASFDILAFEEGYAAEPKPNVKQRICARRM